MASGSAGGIDWDSMKFTLHEQDVRQTWPDEVLHLTPWVIEHLSDLGAVLGMNLDFVGREVPVGGFRADIEARDADGRKVLIENQYGPTDHGHLGQLVLYACESRADVVVWVAAGSRSFALRPMRPEHRRALIRLNRVFAGEISFFGVELEVVSEPHLLSDRADHPTLPKLKLVVRP